MPNDIEPDIRPLAIELSRIVCHREMELHHLAIADAARIKDNPDRLRVSGRVSSHHLVMRRVIGTSGVTGDGAGDTLDMLEHALDALEAAASEVSDL